MDLENLGELGSHTLHNFYGVGDKTSPTTGAMQSIVQFSVFARQSFLRNIAIRNVEMGD